MVSQENGIRFKDASKLEKGKNKAGGILILATKKHIACQGRVYFGLRIIDDDRSSNSGLSYVSLLINNDIGLSLLNSNLILKSHIRRCQSILESLWQSSLTQRVSVVVVLATNESTRV